MEDRREIREQIEKVKKFGKKCKIQEMLSTIPTNLKNTDGENVDKQILRAAILAELDAINLYEQMSELASNEHLKTILLDIAREEKTHVGEFQTLLLEIDKEQNTEMDAGKKEVDNLIK